MDCNCLNGIRRNRLYRLDSVCVNAVRRAQACQMRSAEAVVVPSSARVMMLIL